MRSCISIRGYVCPSVRRFVRPSVRPTQVEFLRNGISEPNLNKIASGVSNYAIGKTIERQVHKQIARTHLLSELSSTCSGGQREALNAKPKSIGYVLRSASGTEYRENGTLFFLNQVSPNARSEIIPLHLVQLGIMISLNACLFPTDAPSRACRPY